MVGMAEGWEVEEKQEWPLALTEWLLDVGPFLRMGKWGQANHEQSKWRRLLTVP